MRIQCAVFDFDGTLYDSMYIWESIADKYVLSLGKTPAPTLREEVRALSLYQAACHLQTAYDLSLSVEEIMAGINGTIEHFYTQEVLPKPGVRAFRARVQEAGIPMCIATASERSHIEAALIRCGLDTFFKEIFTCGEVGQGKDRPDIFRRAMAHFRAERASTFVFEDAIHAARTAKEDGFTVVGVFDESESRQRALQDLADFYLADFAHTDAFWALIEN